VRGFSAGGCAMTVTVPIARTTGAEKRNPRARVK
jgi:hypothetical protein